jgi:hypothetical protein
MAARRRYLVCYDIADEKRLRLLAGSALEGLKVRIPKEEPMTTFFVSRHPGALDWDGEGGRS